MSTWENLLGFSVPGGIEEIAGLWFARGISTQADTMPTKTLLIKNRFLSIKNKHLKADAVSVPFASNQLYKN